MFHSASVFGTCEYEHFLIVNNFQKDKLNEPKMKKKKLDSAVDEDADDGLIKEATATMRQMSQHFTSNTHTKNDNHIATFCHFVNSELTSILQASNNTYVNKAKRKI